VRRRQSAFPTSDSNHRPPNAQPISRPMKHPAAKGCTDDGTLAIVPIYLFIYLYLYRNIAIYTQLGLISWHITQIESQMLHSPLWSPRPMGLLRSTTCRRRPVRFRTAPSTMHRGRDGRVARPPFLGSGHTHTRRCTPGTCTPATIC
jgi:hypothetical protein